MTAFLVPLVLIGGLTSVGVYLLLERNLTRMLLGLLLIGNAVNLLILLVGGPSGNPPVRGRISDGHTTTADPLAQGMILTAIVISMGIAAFVLSLIYRTYRLTTEEEVVERSRGHPRLAAHRRGARPPSTKAVRSRTRPATPTSPTSWTPLPGLEGVAMTHLLGVDPTARADPDDRRGDDDVRRTQAPTAAGDHPERVVGGGRGVRGAALPHRPRRHAGTARRRLGTKRGRHGPAGHHACGGPAFGADDGGLVDRAAGGGAVRHRAGHPRRRRTPTGVDLPAHLSRAVGRRVQRVPGRRPVQPLRRLRGAAGRELRAADHRGEHRARPRRHLLRDGLDGVVDDLPDRHRADLRGDRHAQHGRGRRPARRCFAGYPQRAVRGAARRVRHQGGGVPAVDAGCPTPTRPHRLPSPRCSPAC